MARYGFAAGKGLTKAERAEIATAIVEADRVLLARVDADRTETVETAAEMLFSNFKASRKFREEADQSAEDQRVFDGFLIALSDRPAAALQEAVRRLIRGEVKGLSKTFVPTAAELADLVDRISAEWAYQRNRLERLLKLEEAQRENVGAETKTAAQTRSTRGLGGGRTERPVESSSKAAIYGSRAGSSSKAGEGSR